MTISVIKLGWYSYAVDPGVAAELAVAASEGLIREVSTKTINGEIRAILGKTVEISIQSIEETTENEASVAELKEKLQELEKKIGQCS